MFWNIQMSSYWVYSTLSILAGSLQNSASALTHRMSLPIDPARSPLPPVAQFLAEAALQRQSSLLGADKAGAASTSMADTLSPQPTAQSLTASPVPNTPTPAVPDKASISAQAREQLGAGFDPRDGAVAGQGARAGGASLVPLPSPLAASPAAQGASPTGAQQLAAPIADAVWPAGGLAAPLLRMVSALIQQLTQPPQGSLPQRVVAAQPWPLELAHALESGAVEGDAPLLQTWLVRQGSVLTPDGARGFALTLRAPVAWLGGQSPPLSASPPLAGAATLLVPFAGNAASLQSGVLALVLQGAEASAARTSLTSALLVLDFQPQLPAAVYGRDMLQARLDPWTQMAVLQNSGQVPTDEERARHNARGAQGLCDTVGCPYVARAACVQPFCLQMRGVFVPEAVRPVEPVPPA